MHLSELLALRRTPCAGVFLALTERCPLSCAHCSTDSRMDSPQGGAAPFLRLVRSFTGTDHPQVIFISGGEPLLRPALVRELAEVARRSGTRAAALSGLFFARSGRPVPWPVRRAIESLDHFSVSMDVHHEREVPRTAVFGVLDGLLDTVPGVSLQVTGEGDDDPYVQGLTDAVRVRYGSRIPLLVTRVKAVGRARSLAVEPAAAAAPGGPCDFAGWPLVDYDGTVHACCGEPSARRSRPAHLVLGDAARDPWPVLRARSLGDPVVRAVRVLGATAVRERFGDGGRCGTVCGTCATLSQDADLVAGSRAFLESVPGSAVEMVTLGMVAAQRPSVLAARWGAGRYADLVELGRDPV